MSATYDKLAARFPAEAHRTKVIGGRRLTYVTGEMVVARLNEVLGLAKWAFEVKEISVLDNEVWASGRMTVYTEQGAISRDQAGGQIINRTKAGDVIELSNDIKGAVTDCLKKCATLFGVGLYLYDDDERREVEQEMAAGKRNGSAPVPFKRPAPQASPEEEDRAAALMEGRKAMSEEWATLVKRAEEAKLPELDKIKAIDISQYPEKRLSLGIVKLKARLEEAQAAF